MKSRYLNLVLCVMLVASLVALRGDTTLDEPLEGSRFALHPSEFSLENWANMELARHSEQVVSDGLSLEVRILRRQWSEEPVAIVTLINSGDKDKWLSGSTCQGWNRLMSMEVGGRGPFVCTYIQDSEIQMHGASLVRAKSEESRPVDLAVFLGRDNEERDLKFSLRSYGWPQVPQRTGSAKSLVLSEDEQVWNGELEVTLSREELNQALVVAGFSVDWPGR